MNYTNHKLKTLAFHSRVQLVALAGIIVLAATLRFYRLGDWSFWLDEIRTINRAAIHVNWETIISEWWHPSLSLILINSALETLGVSEWSARLVPALIGIISIPIVYFPIKRLFGSTVALIAVLLLAVSPWHLEWSQTARFYTSLMLLYFLASYVFFLALERDQPAYLLIALLLFVLAIGERFLAVFLVPVALSYLFLITVLPYEKPSGLNKRNITLILVPGVIFGFIDLARYVMTGSSYLLSSIELAVSAPIDDPLRIVILVVYNMGVPLFCLALFGGYSLLLQRNRGGLYFTIGAVVPLLLLAALNPFIFTVNRYVFMTLPCWIILAASAVRQIFHLMPRPGKTLAVAVLALLVADALGAHLMYYQINHGNRPEFRAAFTYVASRKDADDVVVSAVPEIGTYYLGDTVLPLAAIEPAAIQSGDARYWFVIDSENGWWASRQKRWVEENGTLLEVMFLRVRENIHLRIYLYDPGAQSVNRDGRVSVNDNPHH